MARAHDDIGLELRQEIMNVIYEDYCKLNGKLRPVSISDIQGAQFFPWHNNTFEGWFVRVNYADNTFERWFVVDTSGSLSYNDWFVERIYC